jgi:hypothetical protein
MACSQTPDFAQKAITDVLALFIEIGRRTQSSARLDIKLGYLHLYRNGEIRFEHINENKEEDDDKTIYSKR